MGWVVGVFAVFWVSGLWELPVYMACVLKGVFNKVFLTYQFFFF